MPIKPNQEFGEANTTPASPDYPNGAYKNETVPNVSQDGTPMTAKILNDKLGADEALYADVGITPTNVADTAQSSQKLDALRLLAGKTALRPVLIAQGLTGEYGYFSTGFTINDPNDVGVTDSGQVWRYVGSDPLPLVVAVGTVPSAPDYTQVTFNDLQGIVNLDEQSGLDKVYSRSFKIIADLRAATDSAGSTVDFTQMNGFKVDWRGYYAESDGGGNWGIVRVGDSTSLTDDGGSIFVIVNNAVNGVWVEANLSNKVNIKKFGARGNPFDDTQSLNNASRFIKSGGIFDFDGLMVRIVHDGINNNPFVTGGEPNRTSYCFLEKVDNVKFQNGGIYCDNLDMSTNSLVVVGMAGCKFPVFDNFHIIVQASGIPSYDANGYETFASLITLEHHEDQTLSQGLTIMPNCTFMINHPNGGNIGEGESNPVHDYSGKLVGIESRGNTDLGDDFIITDNDIQGVNFYNSTGRLIWMWHSKRNTVKNNKFYLCGRNDTEFCNYGIRVTHYGSDSDYDDNIFEECHITSAGILVSNNNSTRTPVNYSVNNNKARNCTRFDIGFNGGKNAVCNENQFDNVVASFGHIRFIQQTNSEWGQFQVRGNMGINVRVLNPSAEGTGFIYNSASNPMMLDIDSNEIDGCNARAAITMRFHPQNVRRNKIKNCTDYGIYYGTGITGMNIKDNEIEDCPNNYGIGGFTDSQGVYKNNDIKRCFKGLRAGNGSEVYGGRIEDCTETHLEARNSKVRGVNIEDGSNTSSSQTALLTTGGSIPLIEGVNIINNGAFERGINSQIPALVANCGVFGSYAVGAITGASITKLNNYDETGAII